MGLFDFFKKKGAAAGPTPEQSAQVEALVAALQAPDVEGRLAACRGLESLGPAAQGAIPALQELLVDDDNEVCTAAANAMSAIERSL